MKKPIVLLCSCLIFLIAAKVRTTSSEKINWLNLSELKARQLIAKKPVIIDLYTDWCHWCKVMDNTTYANQKVANYINENFYSVKINAETKDTLIWGNRTFTYNPQYKLNMLTLFLTNGQPGFPTTIIIPDETSQPVAIGGYMKANEFELIIKYFGSGDYKTKTFPEFKGTFHASW